MHFTKIIEQLFCLCIVLEDPSLPDADDIYVRFDGSTSAEVDENTTGASLPGSVHLVSHLMMMPLKQEMVDLVLQLKNKIVS